MDTGSGCSIIDLGTLQRIGLDNCIDKRSPKSLINASGDTMNILGSVKIDVTIAGSQPRNHVFQVLDSLTYSNVLLGRDFMRLFGSVQFDFARNRIQLGTVAKLGENGRSCSGRKANRRSSLRRRRKRCRKYLVPRPFFCLGTPIVVKRLEQCHFCRDIKYTYTFMKNSYFQTL